MWRVLVCQFFSDHPAPYTAHSSDHRWREVKKFQKSSFKFGDRGKPNNHYGWRVLSTPPPSFSSSVQVRRKWIKFPKIQICRPRKPHKRYIWRFLSIKFDAVIPSTYPPPHQIDLEEDGKLSEKYTPIWIICRPRKPNNRYIWRFSAIWCRHPLHFFPSLNPNRKNIESYRKNALGIEFVDLENLTIDIHTTTIINLMPSPLHFFPSSNPNPETSSWTGN